MQHGDGEDEGEIEPVRHEDVRFLALHERDQEHQQIGHPDDGQPQVGVPFGLGVFLALGYPEQVAGARDQDEEIVAKHHEPRRQIAGEAHSARLLDDVERGGEQHVAAEGEDHRRSVQRPQPAETGPGQIEVQHRPGQLAGNQEPDGEPGDTPEHRHDRTELDRAHIVIGPAIDLQRRQRGRAVEIPVEDEEHRRKTGNRAKRSMKCERGIDGFRRTDHAEKSGYREDHGQATFTDGHGF